jgi:hypothetical protein
MSRASPCASPLAVIAFLLRDTILGGGRRQRGDARRHLQTVVASGRVSTPQRVSVASVITAGLRICDGGGVWRRAVLIMLDDKDTRVARARCGRRSASGGETRQLRDVALPPRGRARAGAGNLALAGRTGGAGPQARASSASRRST